VKKKQEQIRRSFRRGIIRCHKKIVVKRKKAKKEKTFALVSQGYHKNNMCFYWSFFAKLSITSITSKLWKSCRKAMEKLWKSCRKAVEKLRERTLFCFNASPNFCLMKSQSEVVDFLPLYCLEIIL